MASQERGSGVGDEGGAGQPHRRGKAFHNRPRQAALVMASVDCKASQRIAAADQKVRARIRYA
jgi:hypothetical protein